MATTAIESTPRPVLGPSARRPSSSHTASDTSPAADAPQPPEQQAADAGDASRRPVSTSTRWVPETASTPSRNGPEW